MRQLITVLGLAGVLAAPGLAQAASVTYYGSPCSASTPLPFQVVGVPRLGSTFAFETWPSVVFNRRLVSFSTVYLGLSNQQFGALSLPIPITQLGMYIGYGCGDLLQSADFAIPAPIYLANTMQPVSLAIPVTVPNDPRLVGLTVYSQAMYMTWCLGYCPPGPTTAITASHGARLVVGL